MTNPWWGTAPRSICHFHYFSLVICHFPSGLGGYQLVLVLKLVQLPVNSLELEQFLVSSHFPNPPAMQDDDAIGFLNGRKAMGNDDACPSHHELLNGVPYEQLGFRVDARRCLIQHENPGVKGQSPGEGQELFLPDGERGTAFAHLRVVTSFQFFDEPGSVHDFSRPAQLLAGYLGIAQTNVVRDAARKEKHV